MLMERENSQDYESPSKRSRLVSAEEERGHSDLADGATPSGIKVVLHVIERPPQLILYLQLQESQPC